MKKTSKHARCTRAKGADRRTEIREPLGRGIDRLRDAIQVLPPRRQTLRHSASARPEEAGAQLSTFSLRACEKSVKRPQVQVLTNAITLWGRNPRVAGNMAREPPKRSSKSQPYQSDDRLS